MTKISPFDFIKSINEKTGNMMEIDSESERDYIPFVVNRGLSFSADTLLYANEMNCMPMTDKRMQYDYLYLSVRKRKRYDKWVKPEVLDEDLLKAVMMTYKVGNKRAVEYIRLLSEDQKTSILKSKGGSTAK